MAFDRQGSGSSKGGITRCAIYTRKSTEEGLEQEFNSLDAQREACAAYVMSQRHEGWSLLPDIYDDGGFSGGNMDRPGLRQLLADVAAGKVDVIVVYKVDRLTRSLADFAKIVEVLDRANASFVSITQSFNTTTSMGRLTLNVLLSFAQFEREVTGERIRDKIAASKARGIWMGGVVPLGYEVRDRKLAVVEHEAGTVRHIFQRYTTLGSVAALKVELDAAGVVSRKRLSRNGRTYGGVPFSKGALYLMLQNRIYIGEICNKGTCYPGEHAATVPVDLFEQVQATLERNRVARMHGENANEPSLLAGIIHDARGRRMSPSHAVKQSRRYRYYISRVETSADKAHPTWRIPAGDIEEIVIARVLLFLGNRSELHDAVATVLTDAIAIQALFSEAALLASRFNGAVPSERRATLLRLLKRVEVAEDQIRIMLNPNAIIKLAMGNVEHDLNAPDIALSVLARIVRAGQQVRLAIPPTDNIAPARIDAPLVKLVVKAWSARRAAENSDAPIAELAREQGFDRDYFARLIRLGYLAPDIVSAILEGRQPATLTRQYLARVANLPIDWPGQRQLLGFC